MNYQADLYSSTGVRVSSVLCLDHLQRKRHDLASATTPTDEQCDFCINWQAHINDARASADIPGKF